MNPLSTVALAFDRRLGRGTDRPRDGATAWPVHPAQLLGHLIVVCFALLTVSGLYLAIPYDPGIDTVVYRGASELHHGMELPRSFASIVRISEDLPGGILVRRLHEATAHLLTAAVVLHLLRVLVTGAFRGARALNHLVGMGLFVVVLITGWTGENLPFGLLAGTSLRIGYSVLHSIPYVGEPLAVVVYGGAFPTGLILERSFWAHVLLLPGVIVVGAAVHVWLYRRHTPASVRASSPPPPVTGVRAWPDLAGRLGVLTVATAGLVAASAALVPWSDIELEGPYRVAEAGNTLQPPWFLFFPEGGMRLLPAIHVPLPGGAHVGNVFVAAVAVPILLLGTLALMPWIDRRLTGEAAHPHLLDHPAAAPGRLAFVAALTGVFAVLTVAAASDVIARALQLPVEGVIIALRGALVAVPVMAAAAAWRLARRREVGT